MPGTLVGVRGTRLYVDERGDERRPGVLIVHGGPGMGCGELMWAVGDRLAERLHVVAVDQRGCARSDAVPVETITIREIIADLEVVRAKLGVERWALLAHSAGAPIALEYAAAHTDRVTALVLDCPALDADPSDRARLRAAAELLRARGRPADDEAADAALQMANHAERLGAATGARELMQALGEDYMRLFLHDARAENAVERAVRAAGLTEEEQARGYSHDTLRHELYVPRFELAGSLPTPQLLVRGVGDLVTPPSVVASYRAAVPDAHVREIRGAAHFPALERPKEYASVVGDFVLATG